MLNDTTNFPNILPNKTFTLSHIFQVSQGLLSGNPFKMLLKSKETMFIGSCMDC